MNTQRTGKCFKRKQCAMFVCTDIPLTCLIYDKNKVFTFYNHGMKLINLLLKPNAFLSIIISNKTLQKYIVRQSCMYSMHTGILENVMIIHFRKFVDKWLDYIFSLQCHSSVRQERKLP